MKSDMNLEDELRKIVAPDGSGVYFNNNPDTWRPLEVPISVAVERFKKLLTQSNVEVLDRLGGELQGKEKVLPSEHPEGLPLKNKSEMYCRGYNQAVEEIQAIIERQKQQLSGED